MAGLVDEIQRDALDLKAPVSTLLRKVKVAASKLSLGEVENWVHLELGGYRGADLPIYRILYGRPEAFNPQVGWIPIMLGNRELDETLERCEIREALPTLETTIAKSELTTLRFPIDNSIIADINAMSRFKFGRMTVALSISQAQGILDAVRGLVLDWALALEKRGVMGEGMGFSEVERARAGSEGMTFNIGSIGNFAGNLGTGNTAGSITLNVANWSDLRKFADQVSEASSSLGSDGADTTMLDVAVEHLKAEVAKPDPDRGVVRGLLTDVRNAVSGAAGSLIASGIIAQVASFLGP